MSRALDPAAVREHLLVDRRGVVEATIECADVVAASWSEGGTTGEGSIAGETTSGGTTDREAVVGSFRTLLSETGLLDAYPSVLAECVAAAGGELRAEPVAAPPYVAVTSVGPVLRATLAPGRLVVTLAVFGVEQSGENGHPRYVRVARTPEAAVEVEIRDSR